VFSYLNTLFLNIDANFRLKNCAHKNGHTDIPYGDGLSYFVDLAKFNHHLREYTHCDEVMLALIDGCMTLFILIYLQITTCAGFQALSLSNMKLV
jgi:hypothetical protein